MKTALMTTLWFILVQFSHNAFADIGYQGLLYSNDHNETPKYGGAFGTGFTVNRPQAIYHPGSNKTYFTFTSNLGTRQADGMAYQVSCYDHNKKALCDEGPVVYQTREVADAHDNPAILIDDGGFIWLYVSGRGHECVTKKVRCGEVYRSAQPGDITRFFQVESEQDFAYAQPWRTDAGKVLLFTRYNKHVHRQIWIRKADGKDYLLVTGGHYFVSVAKENEIHIAYASLHDKWGGRQWNADLRTNLYYIYSLDSGETWQTSGCRTGRAGCFKFTGKPKTGATSNQRSIGYDFASARVMRTVGQTKTYMQDIRLSDDGEVLVLFTQSTNHRPVPAKRVLKMARLVRDEWHFRRVDRFRALSTTHNYSNGFIEANGDVIAPFSSANRTLNENFSGGELVRYEYDDTARNYASYSHVFHSNFRHNNNVKDVINKTEESAKDFAFFWGDSPIYPGKDYRGESFLYFANSALEVTQMAQ